MKKFADFSEENKTFSEPAIRIDDILDKPIIVWDYYIGKSHFKDSQDKQRLTLQIEVDGEKRVIFTKSEILIRQIEKYAKELPFEAKIIKPKRYYTFQ